MNDDTNKFFMDLKKQVYDRCLKEKTERNLFHMINPLTDKQRHSAIYLDFLMNSDTKPSSLN